MGWYVARNGKVRGPFAKDALREMIALGEIDASCRLRSANETADTWRSLDEIAELSALRPSHSVAPPTDPTLPMAPASLPPRFERATLIERAEKGARLVLWLALSAASVMVSLGVVKERKVEADTQARIKEATRAAEEKFESLQKSVSDRTSRIPFESIGNGLTALNVENATGQLWFTNVSPRSGHVCVVGEATNAATHTVTTSLPACAEVSAYASAVHLTLLFPGQQLVENCKVSGCGFQVSDAARPKN